MKNIDLAKKIKQLRARKGLSQDELGEMSKLNLRTIQRIESGETEPRGDTLKKLANALDTTPDELIDWTEQVDAGFLVLLNLSALSFLAFPLLGIIVPLALWVLKKDKIKNVNETGKQLLNFQISWSIAIFLVYTSFFTGILSYLKLPEFSFHMLNMGGMELILVLFLPMSYLVNIVFILVNAIRSFNSKLVHYRPAVRFL